MKLQGNVPHHIRRAVQKLPRSKKARFIVLAVLLMAMSVAVLLVHLTTPVYSPAHYEVTHTDNRPWASAWPKKPKPTPPPPTPPPIPQPSAGRYGLSISEQLDNLSTTQLGAALDDIKQLGVSRLRMDFSWNSIQGNSPQKYSWTNTDRVVAAANVRGFTVLGVIDQAPAWARSSACPNDIACAPASSSAFAAFAATVASRYTPMGVHEWEVWNEPNNNNFWRPAPNAAAYTQLLQQSYIAIKRINPGATVISGGLAPVDTTDGNIPALDFTAALYADGAKPYFDAFGFHPYSFPALTSTYATWNAWSQMAATTPSIRSTMTAYGDGAKQIWATEYGAPTGGPGAIATTTNLNFVAHPDHVSEDLQANMVTDMVTSATADSWLGPVFWYGYRDQGTDTSTNENFFGLLRYDGSQKPAYFALRNAIKQ